MTGEGHRNLITDVAGIRVGNAEDNAARTGVTVVLPDAPAVAAVDVRGGGTGTRELALLEPSATAEAAGRDFALGNAGAGLGASSGLGAAGGLKGGLGSASCVAAGGFTIGALAAVNSCGSVLMPDTGTFWAWPFERSGEYGGRKPPIAAPANPDDDVPPALPGTSTTLAVVATDAALTKAQAERVAIMAQGGLARAIRPVHTPYDGDVVFVIATGQRRLAHDIEDIWRIGALAADCTARAIARGVYEARSLGEMGAYRDLFAAE